MPGRTLRLDADALWSLAEELDVATALHAAVLVPADPGGEVVRPDPASVVFRDRGDEVHLPAADLVALRDAALAAATARRLVAPGVVTAGVISTCDTVGAPDPARPSEDRRAPWHLGVLCRSVPDISHVAVFTDGRPLPPRVLDQLDLAGIGLTVTATPAEAVTGATLVLTLGAGSGRLAHRLARGAVLVNAGPHPAPDDTLGSVDRVCAGEDLIRALTGAAPGRAGPDETILVEPPPPTLGRELDAALAHLLATTALDRDRPPDLDVVGPL